MAQLPFRSWLAALGIAATAAAPAGCGAELPARQVGPFEITAQARRVGDSGRWMRTGNPFGTYGVRSYRVAWGGRPVTVGKGVDRFWQVLQLPLASQPTLLLTNGPNLHLVSDAGGRLVVQDLAPESGSVTLQWLDARAGQPDAEFPGFGQNRVEAAPQTELSGGRWLYVRHRLVLDTATLATFPVEPWAREGEGETVIEMNASNSPAVAFSPGRTRLVLLAEGRDYGRGGERFDLLLVVELATGKPEPLRLDAARTPYDSPGAIDAAWIDRYFRWERDAAGREVLAPK
jgi:hypothetical protein